MIFVEPDAVYEARLRQPVKQVESRAPVSQTAYTGWQESIALVVRANKPQPVLIMRLVNECATVMGKRPKSQRDAIKREILREVGAMIREGKLMRVRRKFVELPFVSKGEDGARPLSKV